MRQNPYPQARLPPRCRSAISSSIWLASWFGFLWNQCARFFLFRLAFKQWIEKWIEKWKFRILHSGSEVQENFRKFRNKCQILQISTLVSIFWKNREIPKKFHQNWADEWDKLLKNEFLKIHFWNLKKLDAFCWNFEAWAVQKYAYVNIVDLVKSFLMAI